MNPAQNVAEARHWLQLSLFNTVMALQATRNGTTGNGNAVVDLPEALEAIAVVAARIVMLHPDERERMKAAAGFDIAFLREHRNREKNLLAS